MRSYKQARLAQLTMGVQEKLAELGVLDEGRAEVEAGVDLEPLTVRLRQLVGPDLMVEADADFKSTDWSLWLHSQFDDEGAMTGSRWASGDQPTIRVVSNKRHEIPDVPPRPMRGLVARWGMRMRSHRGC